MMMKIQDTLSGRKKSLLKSKKGALKLFVCGPTVYDYIHIGNARTFIVFDALVKYLRSQGYKIFYLQNITDIDDKIIRRAEENNTTPKEIAVSFEKAFLEDMQKLGVDATTKYARATDYIPEIAGQVQTLVKKGFAYKIEGDGYYFDIAKSRDYGKLAKRTREQAQDATSRIDESVRKRNKGDFNLWKFRQEGEPSWETPLGRGRPGWHIEDTAITEHHFGPQYDIHGGGRDLIFPHHEAEIAQQESASGKKPFVRIWTHIGFVTVNGEKMSKSLGNFITVREFLKKHPPEILRFLVLAHHYPKPLDYTEKTAEAARHSLETIKEFLGKTKLAVNSGVKKPLPPALFKIGSYAKEFQNASNDDFNTPKAIAAIFSLISKLQKRVWRMNPTQAQTATKFIKDSLKAMGLAIKVPKIPLKIRQLADRREQLRNEGRFGPADKLRKKIEKLGYEVEDTPIGSYIKPRYG